MFKVNILAEVIIYEIYRHHMESDTPFLFETGDSELLLKKKISKNTIQAAIDKLRAPYDKKLLKRHGNKGLYKYEISIDGIEHVQAELRRKASPISYYSSNPDELEKIIGIETFFVTQEELDREDYWRPLEIDRNSKKVEEAISELDTAVKIIQADNGLAVTYPEERQGILQSLKNGLEWLKNSSPTKAQLRYAVIAPLNWIVSNFAKSALAEAAKRAVVKIFDAFF